MRYTLAPHPPVSMSGKRRLRERQPAVAGDGDKMTTEGRMDVVLAVCRTPQFRLGVVGGLALLFGWTWKKKNGRRRIQEQEAETKKQELSSQSELGVGGVDETVGCGSGFAADGGALETSNPSVVEHPIPPPHSRAVAAEAGDGGEEARELSFSSPHSQVDLISSLQLTTLSDPIHRVPVSSDKHLGDGAVAGCAAPFAPAPYSPQKEVVKEVTEAGRFLSPDREGRVEHGVDSSLPYVEDDREDALDGDRICSVCPDSVAVSHTEQHTAGNKDVEAGGTSEQRNDPIVSSFKEGNSVHADDLHGMDCGESGIASDSCSQNVGDVALEPHDVGSDDAKASSVSVLESVPPVEAGDFGHVATEEKGPVTEEAASRDAYPAQLDVLVRDGSRDVGFSEGAAGVNEVRRDTQENGEGCGNGREDDMDGGETETEVAGDWENEGGIDEHTGDADEGRRKFGNGGTELNRSRSEDEESRREDDEDREELAEDQQRGTDDVQEPKLQQFQVPAKENGVIHVGLVTQDDSTYPNAVLDLDSSSEDITDVSDVDNILQSQVTASEAEAERGDSFCTGNDGDSDSQDKHVSSVEFNLSGATHPATVSEDEDDEDDGAQTFVERPALNNVVNGLTSQGSLDRYDEYLADPKLPEALRSQVMRAKAALQKFYDLKGMAVPGNLADS